MRGWIKEKKKVAESEKGRMKERQQGMNERIRRKKVSLERTKEEKKKKRSKETKERIGRITERKTVTGKKKG